MRTLRYLLLALLLCSAWSALVVEGVLQGWFRQPIANYTDRAGFMRGVTTVVRESNVGNCMVALLEQGHIAAFYHFSIGAPVQADTRYQMASISKWVTAWGVLRLADEGRIDLDAPVDRYLKRWHLPPSEFANERVTVRRLLSHSAGLGDGLGFLGYAPGTPMPSLVEELGVARDHAPRSDGHIGVTHAPGDTWRYSGGGYLILQLLIEDVSGEPFAQYMQHAVLAPLGMNASTFDANVIPLAKLATFYDEHKHVATHYRFVALSAASLYSSAEDMAQFALAHARGLHGEAPGRGVLKPTTVRAMAVPTSYLAGIHAIPAWGLGVRVHPLGHGGTHIIGHDGNNFPALHHAVRIDPGSGDGIVVLGSGDNTLAARIAEQWLFWHTGRTDIDGLRFQPLVTLLSIGAGWFVVIAGVVLVARRRRTAS